MFASFIFSFENVKQFYLYPFFIWLHMQNCHYVSFWFISVNTINRVASLILKRGDGWVLLFVYLLNCLIKCSQSEPSLSRCCCCCRFGVILKSPFWTNIKSSVKWRFDIGAAEIALCLQSTLFFWRHTDINLMTDYLCRVYYVTVMALFLVFLFNLLLCMFLLCLFVSWELLPLFCRNMRF